MAFGSFDNGKGASSTVSEINMVPLIDVMLVLLVIFIITAPLLSHSIKINVPQATAQPVEQEPRVIDLAINAEGGLFWNETAVSPDELKARFAAEAVLEPQAELRIRADLNTRYETLAQVMSSAKAGGLKRIGFITRPGATGTSGTGEPVGAAGAGSSAGGGGAQAAPPTSSPDSQPSGL